MKLINELVADVTASNNVLTQPDALELPQIAKDILNHTFNEMMACKSSWRVGFKTKDEVKNYKIALGKAMHLAKIDSYEKLQFGLDALLLDDGKYLPSVGQFVKWCKDGYNQDLHQKNLLGNTKRILDERRMLANGTFEQRQETARNELGKCLDIIKSNRGEK